jgi:hypothetical protein
MKSEKARQYFLEHQSYTEIDKDLLISLDNLSLYHDKIQDLNTFMKEFSIIVNWEKLNNIKYIIESGNEPENIQYILDIQAWAKKTFSDSLINGDTDKLILSYLLGYYLFLEPTIDFQWENSNKNLENKLKELLTKIKVEIIIPKNAPYSERKYYDDYRNSITSNSFKKIFDFLSVTEHGRGYDHRFVDFFSTITNICYKINPDMISETIANYEPVLIKMMINALNPYQVNKIFKEYNAKSSLPLLIGLIHIINPSWNNKYDTSLENDYEFIYNASLIVKKIADRTKTDNLYKYITDSSNIFGNKLWHSIFIAFGVQNPIFLDSYISSIDLSYDFGAENVFDTFCQFIEDEILLDDFSVKIYDRYLEFLLKERSYLRNYCGTNYIRFMVQAVYVKSEKSHIKYSEMLKKVSIDFERALYSWDKKQISMRFTKLIFWILGLSLFLDYVDADEMDLTYTIKIFSNEKYLNAFNTSIENIKIDYKIFADYLKNPTANITINLPLSHNSYTTINFNGNSKAD